MPQAVTRIAIPLMIAVGIGFALVALFSAGDQPGRQDGLDRFAVGDLKFLDFETRKPQPTIEFEDAAGATKTLADWRGEVLVVNLWGEWCPPCVEEMPTLAELQTRVAHTGTRVLAVAMDRDYNRDANYDTLWHLTGGRLDFYFDMTYGIAFEAGAAGFPTTLIYDREGVEVARFAGAADWSSDNAIGLIEAIAAR